MSRVIDNSSDPFHRKSIRTALRAWNNVQKLGTHPLAKLAIVQKRQQEANRPNAVSNLGLSLRDVLRSAIEELRADAGEPAIDDPSWRPYIILKEEYIEGRAAEYLAVQFGELPLRTYQGWRAKALDSLADILRQWEDDQQLTTVVTPQLPAVAERRQGTNGYQTESSYGTLLVNEPLATITPIQGLDQVPVA